ncbi:hypothetical protein BHE74_00022442 [Ensete ventricosum]|nr:hypothetical protein GW17_00057999 [Ensete ventricosum]RWW69922.1 hypothetical protein BHE74_00022442 [Ensete ventricosum]
MDALVHCAIILIWYRESYPLDLSVLKREGAWSPDLKSRWGHVSLFVGASSICIALRVLLRHRFLLLTPKCCGSYVVVGELARLGLCPHAQGRSRQSRRVKGALVKSVGSQMCVSGCSCPGSYTKALLRCGARCGPSDEQVNAPDRGLKD